MKSLKKRIENLNLRINSSQIPKGTKTKIGEVDNPMASGRITKTLDKTKDTRTTEKIKTHI